MRVLQKTICERCFALYGAEVEAEGWYSVTPARELGLEGGVCSFCGKVEGRQTIQIDNSALRDDPEKET